jgi:hypothetical protein
MIGMNSGMIVSEKVVIGRSGLVVYSQETGIGVRLYLQQATRRVCL